MVMDATKPKLPLDSVEIGHYAEQFGPFHGRCWFNTAHQGPMPNPAVQKAREAIEQRIRPHEIRDTDFFQVPELLREALGKLINVSPEEVVLGNSTTYGLDLLANGIPWKAGDEVLVVKGDFQQISRRGLSCSSAG
jgi:selenocysteine lyase/cysteine desulfurase